MAISMLFGRHLVRSKLSLPIILIGHALSDLMFRESAGWYHHPAQDRNYPSQSLYVNEGIGCTAPVRINCPSEITLITLHTGKK